MTKEVTLPSGTKLKVSSAPFADASALYKAIAAEAKALVVNAHDDLDVNLLKNAICVLVASDRIEACLWKCLDRCTYNGLKMTQDTFESDEARMDYFPIMREVIEVNISPFLKSLYAELSPLVKMVENLSQA